MRREPQSDFLPTQALAALAPPPPLFRPQALAAWGGPRQAGVLLRPLVGSAWITLFALAAAAALIAWLVLGSYTRRATVSGHLAPAAGVIRVVAPVAGWVLEQHAAQGQRVEAGAVLFVLSTDRPTLGGADFQAQVIASLRRRQALLQQSRLALHEAAVSERNGLQRRIDNLQTERPVLAAQLAEQRRRIALAEDVLALRAGLLDLQLIAREDWLQKQADLSDQRSRLDALRRELLALEREVNAAQQALTASRTREADTLQGLLRETEQLQQQAAEAEAKRRVVVTAARAGTLSLVHASPGMAVDAQRALAQLLPADEPLLVQLYAPSRAIGMVRPGTRVWLRYQAFPFERYGMQPAEVVAVASTPASADELSPWLGAGAGPGASASEPFYQITARLPAGRFDSQAGAVELRAGLRVDADLLFERRRLIEWMLRPALQSQLAAAP